MISTALPAAEILFSSRQDGSDFDVYKCLDTGGQRINLTKSPDFDEFNPRMSPDHSCIAFDARNSKNIDYSSPRHRIGVMSLADNITRWLTGDSCNSENPSFSPDGKSLVFSSNTESDSGQFAVFRCLVDGSGLERLSAYSPSLQHPAFTPDGEGVLFDFVTESSAGSRCDICILDIRTGKIHSPTEGLKGTWFSCPVMSPDGKTLVFAQEHSGTGSSISCIDMKTGNFSQPLPSWGNVLGSLSFSPDGRTVAFGSHGRIFIITLSEGKPSMLGESDTYDICPSLF